jgi:hypothetical protein
MSSPTADLSIPGRPGPGVPSPGSEDIERRRLLLRQWRRHSALIGVLRRLLPALCVLILAAIAVWAGLNVIYGRGEGARVLGDANIRMLNPYLQGRTDKGQPYLVQAASAVRDKADSARMTLDRPVLTLGAGGPTWTVVRANNGVYREDNGLLDLHGQVTLDDYKGNHLVTEHAFVDTRKNNVDGETRIIGHGPLGAIDASSYSLRDGGAYLHFEGHVKSRIEHASTLAPSTAAAPAAPGPAPTPAVK